MDKNEQSKIIVRNSILSIGIKFVDYLLTFITAPLLLACLGDYKYGVYASTLSIISWIYYFDFGIGSGMRNRVAESTIQNDYVTAKKYVSTAYFLVGLLSVIFLAIVIVALQFVDTGQLLNANVSGENLNLILAIAFLLAAVNFVLALSLNILYAIQKTAMVNAIGMISKLVMLVGLIVFKITGFTMLLSVVVIEGAAQIIKNIVAIIYLKTYNSRLSFSPKSIDLSFSHGILGFGIQIFIMQISALVLNSTDNLIIMKLFSASDVTPYNLCFKYFSIINVIYSAAISPMWTAYTTAYVNREGTYIRKILDKNLKFYILTLLGIIVACFVFKPFMKIYLSKSLDYPKGQIVLMAIYFAILIFSHNFSSFVHGISKVKYTTIACVISAVCNIPLSIMFAKSFDMKINGIIMGSIVSICITTIVYVHTTISEIRKLV